MAWCDRSKFTRIQGSVLVGPMTKQSTLECLKLHSAPERRRREFMDTRCMVSTGQERAQAQKTQALCLTKILELGPRLTEKKSK
jgi:hypothetical protein